MKKRIGTKRSVCLGIIGVILIIWLLCGNYIIASLWNLSHEISVNSVQYQEVIKDVDTTISSAVDYCYVTNDILDIYAINGWVFCEEANVDLDQGISVLLQSTSRAYCVNSNLYQRVDNMLGYGAEFSLLGIRPGIYNVKLIYSENGVVRACSTTNQYIEVKNDGIKEWEYESEVVEMNQEKIVFADSLTYDPGIKVDSNRIELWGWLIDEGKDSSKQTIAYSLEDEDGELSFYSTMPVERQNLAESYGDSLYSMSGFWGGISRENMDQKSWKIRLYVQQGDEWYQAKHCFVYDKDTEEISWINEANTVKQYESNVVDVRDMKAPVLDSFLYDPGILVKKNGISLYGWIFEKGKDSSKQEVVVSLEDELGKVIYYDTTSIEREAVAEKFGNSIYSMSGFQAGIKGNDMDQHTWIIRIYVQRDDKWYRPKHYFVYDKDAKTVSWINETE